MVSGAVTDDYKKMGTEGVNGAALEFAAKRVGK